MPERRKKSNLKSTRHHAARRTKPAKIAKKTAKAAPKAKKPAAVKPPAATAHAHKEGALSVYDVTGKAVDTMNLDPIFHKEEVNGAVVYQAVLMYQAGMREGTAATKTRGEVRGGGKKPWKQKGTGQARHGSRRSPIWRGGGVTFGPHPRDYSYTLPTEIKRQAVTETMKDKVSNGKMVVIDKLAVKEPRTREIAKILRAFKLERPLIVVEEKTEYLLLASRNIPNLTVKTSQEVNALDVASHRECLITKSAYAGLVKRLKS